MTNKIDFSNNWNGKLNNAHFTTIRHDINKYPVGGIFELWLKDSHLGNVKVISITHIKLSELEKKDVICYQDTGYDGKSTKAMIETMYKKHKITDDTLFAVILLRVQERFQYVPNPKITETNNLFEI